MTTTCGPIVRGEHPEQRFGPLLRADSGLVVASQLELGGREILVLPELRRGLELDVARPAIRGSEKSTLLAHALDREILRLDQDRPSSATIVTSKEAKSPDACAVGHGVEPSY